MRKILPEGVNVSTVLTFGENVLHDGLKLIGTDLHVLMEEDTLHVSWHVGANACPVLSLLYVFSPPQLSVGKWL